MQFILVNIEEVNIFKIRGMLISFKVTYFSFLLRKSGNALLSNLMNRRQGIMTTQN